MYQGVATGKISVERFVEIGVKSAPTVAGLATNTLKLPEYSHNTTAVLNSERDAAADVMMRAGAKREPSVTAGAIPGRVHRNGGGDRYDFDGRIAVVKLPHTCRSSGR